MRKKIAFLSILTGILCVAGTANAAPPYTNTAGAPLTVGLAGTDPAVITFQPSPGVMMSAYTTSSAYSLNAMNSVATAGNQNEYLIVSTKAGYYQKAIGSTSAAATAPTTLTSEAQAVTNYTYQGGGS